MRPNNPFPLLTEALEEIPKAEEAMAILILHELGSDLPRELPLRSILESLARAHGNALPPIAFHVFLEKLWEFPPLMRRLAARRDAPPEALERLAQHPDPEVRATLAFNPRVRPEILEALYRDPTLPWWVLKGLVRNPNTPREVLEAIVRARWGRGITERARARLSSFNDEGQGQDPAP